VSKSRGHLHLGPWVPSSPRAVAAMFALATAVCGFMVQPAVPPMPAHSGRAAVTAVRMFGEFMKKSPGDENSFVQTEMRGAAMRLHTKQQAPKEGKAAAKKVEQTPVQTWVPSRADYLQFLVDSQLVYRTLDEAIANTEALAPLRNSGLERSAALERDIAWFEAQGVTKPSVAPQGSSYAAMIEEMVAKGELEAFLCHFYNFYFAHTAGGRMIGKRMAAQLLDNKTLDFYKWQNDGAEVDPTEKLLPQLRGKIDGMVESWTREQKDALLAQTADSFKYGGALLQHISVPDAAKMAAKA